MAAISSTFELIDYCVFAAVLVISAIIGGYLSYKGSKSPEEYLLGNRQFSPLPISISMSTSFLSAISLLGLIGEVYAHGCQVFLLVVGSALGIIASGIIFLPVFHPLKLTSVNEFIQMRFQSNALTTCISLLSCLRTVLYAGLCLYAPTVALVAVSPLDYMTYIWLLGIICTLYSTFGGIRAVVWTDVYQFSFMTVGMIIIFILGTYNIGGFIKAWSIASKGGRLEVFNMDTSIFTRHTFLNVTLNGFINTGCLYGVNQIYVQRLCSVSSIINAKKALRYAVFGSVLVYLFIYAVGILVYAIYADCDPMSQGLINRKEGILPFLIVDKLNYVSGLPGLFVATLIGATLSSVSSVINAIGALLWRDFLYNMTVFKEGSSSLAMVANKSLSLLTGCLCIGTAMLFSKVGSLLQVLLTVMGVFAGPFLAVFLLGIFFPRCNYKGAFAGIFVSFIFVGWISVGALFYGAKPAVLPMSTEKCNIARDFYLNSTLINDTEIEIQNSTQQLIPEVINDIEIEIQNSTQQLILEDSESNLNRMWLYDISYTLYGFIGMIFCLTTAVIVSYITGWQDLNEVPPECIAPCIRKYYWLENNQIFLKHQKEDKKIDVPIASDN